MQPGNIHGSTFTLLNFRVERNLEPDPLARPTGLAWRGNIAKATNCKARCWSATGTARRWTRADHPAATELRTVLVRLNGRQLRRGRGWTTPALLEGVWVLLAALELLEDHDLSHLRALAEILFHPETQK